MSNYVLVLDTNKRPLTPCKSSMARKLLEAGKAAIFRRFPFTIILKKEVNATPEPLTVKIDPGSKTTGFAILKGNQVIFGAELTHRGQAIKASLDSRRAIRRGRRSRHTRYRASRFLNRTRPKGWLAPSLQHRVETTMSWVNKFIKLAPIGSIENVPLQIEHIQPKANGGTNRISNLCLACEKCNLKKGTQTIEKFLAKKPDVLKRVLAQAKRPLKDAAAVNSTRWALFSRLKQTGLPVSKGSGGLTKFNRTRLELPKTHWLDAACVGQVDELEVMIERPLRIKAAGQGTRQKSRTDKYGFPCRYVPDSPFVKGFQTGDIVKAVVTSGKKIGTYLGRVAVRSTGSFNISTANSLIQGISHKYCTLIHKKDGYSYA